ncbi:hypothetical protein HYX02_07920 [Candidatus Woesearchaeota archaeon]|nr:hypothetical protein [Candidatus Woesearchaeota archaeon]
MKSKKIAQFSDLTNMVIVALVILIVFLWVGRTLGRATGPVGTSIGSGDDYDEDGVINAADDCPCLKGEIINYGCPEGYKPTINEDKPCPVKKNDKK